jgi:nucleoside-diphosphate-sugar epimerase
VFNIAAGSPASVNHVAETIGVILGKPVEKRFEPPRPGDIHDSWGDISAARETLGYEPRVDLAAGLELTAEAIVARV